MLIFQQIPQHRLRNSNEKQEPREGTSHKANRNSSVDLRGEFETLSKMSSEAKYSSGFRRSGGCRVKRFPWILLSFCVFVVATSGAIRSDSLAEVGGLDVDYDVEVDAEQLNVVDVDGGKALAQSLAQELGTKGRSGRSLLDAPETASEEKCSEGQSRQYVLGSWMCVGNKEATSNHRNSSSSTRVRRPSGRKPAA